MLRHKLSDYFTVVDNPADAVAWCLKQPRRELPQSAAPEREAYRRGVLHGAAVGLAATALLAALLARR